tara:strand:+ start:178 stop:768 length:591 start_codon:yes stop_codon:yes gene_type:complete
MHNELSKYIPKNSIHRIAKWIEILQIDLKFVKPRITKLGDFRYNYKNGLQITINNDLNPYQTLITLVHEIAHAFVYKKFGSKVKAHGKEWKEMYKSLMLNFLKPNIFPSDILSCLSLHIINPAASSNSDTDLVLILRKYDDKNHFNISQIEFGEKFNFSGKIFIKEEKLRKRFKCLNTQNQRYYLFNPTTIIKIFK